MPKLADDGRPEHPKNAGARPPDLKGLKKRIHPTLFSPE